MIYRVIWSRRSREDLQLLDDKTRSRIIAKVEKITDDPFGHVKHLVGVPLYSLRVGSYRVIMDIKAKEIFIFVVKVGHSSRVYDDL